MSESVFVQIHFQSGKQTPIAYEEIDCSALVNVTYTLNTIERGISLKKILTDEK